MGSGVGAKTTATLGVVHSIGSADSGVELPGASQAVMELNAAIQGRLRHVRSDHKCMTRNLRRGLEIPDSMRFAIPLWQVRLGVPRHGARGGRTISFGVRGGPCGFLDDPWVVFGVHGGFSGRSGVCAGALGMSLEGLGWSMGAS